MESAVIPSMHLLPQWLTRLLEECSEGDPDEALGVKCLRGQGRVVLWSMCVDMGVNLHGIPGQACRLLERFLATQLRQFHQQTMTEERWQEAKRRVLTHLPLLMASCVQLAVKMSCADIPMSANVGRAFLASRGVYYSMEEIKESEYNVFRMLGFRIPLWTSVDAAEVLAVFLGMPLAMLQPVVHFVNLTELYRDKLESRVRWAAAPTSGSSSERPDLNSAFLPTLHLVAGAVVACARCRPCPGLQPVPNPGPRLAELLRVPLCYVRCIADAIISTIMEGDSPKKRFSDFREDSDNPRKRRRE